MCVNLSDISLNCDLLHKGNAFHGIHKENLVTLDKKSTKGTHTLYTRNRGKGFVNLLQMVNFLLLKKSRHMFIYIRETALNKEPKNRKHPLVN